MSAKNMKSLTRSDLLEILVELKKENDALKEQLAQAQRELSDRRIVIEEAGSLAEAALKLNGVFEAAMAACEQYKENIRMRQGEGMPRTEQMPVASPEEPVASPEEPVAAAEEPVAAPEEPVAAPEEPVAQQPAAAEPMDENDQRKWLQEILDMAAGKKRNKQSGEVQ